MEHKTYADHELSKINQESEKVTVKIRDDNGSETRWISITPETLRKVRAVLAKSPECQW